MALFGPSVLTETIENGIAVVEALQSVVVFLAEMVSPQLQGFQDQLEGLVKLALLVQ